MRHAKLSCTEFYSCYLQQCRSIDLFSYRTPGHGQKDHMNKVCPSFCSELSMELALQFFLELNVVLGAHVMLCMTEADFLKIMFCPQNKKIGQAQGCLNVQESSVFFSVLYFFIKLVYNESLYYCNSCMLEQISYLGKFWFQRYDPKCSSPIRLQDFLINRRTLKLAVFHKEINKINWFWCVHPTAFSGMAHQVFLIFGKMIGNLNMEKLTESFFQENSFLAPTWAKRPRMCPKQGFGDFLKNFVMLAFFENNL